MAEWIEILWCITMPVFLMSPLAMAEWIEIIVYCATVFHLQSPLAMAEWIEMSMLIGKRFKQLSLR